MEAALRINKVDIEGRFKEFGTGHKVHAITRKP
jgi:hypothetical protein